MGSDDVQSIDDNSISQDGEIMTPYSPQEPQSVTARRYRNSDYFRDDMLKCSDVVDEFKSVKSLVDGLQAFSLQHKFVFATETVEE